MITIETAFKYKNMLINIAYKRLNNYEIAEDLVQDVYIKVLKELNNFESLAHCKAWLIKSTINRVNTYVKSAYFRHTNLSKDITDIEEILQLRLSSENNIKSMEELLLKQEQKEEIWKIVNNLKLPYKRVLIEYYYNNRSILEIAKLLGEPEGTIKARLCRGRRQVEKYKYQLF